MNTVLLLHTCSNCSDFFRNSPLNFSLEYSSIFHFNLPFHHFNLLFLCDIPSQMRWSDHSVTLFFTASGTALNSAVAFSASLHPPQSYPLRFRLTPLSFPPRHVPFLWPLLPFYEGHASLYLYEDANMISEAPFGSVIHYFRRSTLPPSLVDVQFPL